jgi:hypothetical protein
LECRNNQEARNLVADVITVFSLSDKTRTRGAGVVRIGQDDYIKDHVISMVHARHMNYIADTALPDDDDEVRIAANEIACAIHSKDGKHAIYWLHWLDSLNGVKKKNGFAAVAVGARPVEGVDLRYSSDWIWFIWKICICQKADQRILCQIEALFQLSLVEFNTRTRKTKIKLLEFGLILLTEERIDWNIPVVARNDLRIRACGNVNKLYFNIIGNDEQPVAPQERKIIYHRSTS